MNWNERWELGSVRVQELRAEAARADLLKRVEREDPCPLSSWTFCLTLPRQRTLRLRLSLTRD